VGAVIWRQEKCPNCNRKGLHYGNHPHAVGWKNYRVILCRFCGIRYDADKLEKYILRHRGIDGRNNKDKLD
jgi:hypothetical protein